MSRREALALLLVALLILGGRLVRQAVLVDSAGAWRDPGWLEDRLPPPAESAEREPAPAAATPAVVDPNTCPRDALLALPGIGPALADRILAARERGVHFATPADLRQVKGIGPALAAKLAPWLVFAAGDTTAAAAARAVP